METGNGGVLLRICRFQVFQFPDPIFHPRFVPRLHNGQKKRPS
jgi:hypothetical protein